MDASFEFGEAEHPKRSGLQWIATSFAESLARVSYDLPFIFRRTMELPRVHIVYLDEKSARLLNTNLSPWDRGLHAQLVRRLTMDGARAVFFDIFFADPGPDPTVDADFAAAIRENGGVTLGGITENAFDSTDKGGAIQERALPPTKLLRSAAATWGLLSFRPMDADYGIRRFYAGTETVPSATWRTAMRLGAPISDSAQERAIPRWVNYYGPPGSFPSISYDRALAPDGLPEGFFKGGIVFIGARSVMGELMLGKEEFRNPYSRFGWEFSSGVEVHLTQQLNLLRGDWLHRLDGRLELWLSVGFGLLLGGLLPLLRPNLAALAAFIATATVAASALWEFQNQQLWFAWCIPAFVQAPTALAWALGTRYFVEERRRLALRDAFGHYLSPQMADRIADAEFDLSPGGTVVEASLLMTDLEGFALLAERLADPDRLSQILIEYFSLTTKHILENDGAIINMVGDAVFGAWGTLAPDPKHPHKAALAALKLHESSRMAVDGRPLRTRVGLHTGRVLAGNIGSAERFDYCVVGDAVNFTSRLEGLNKHLGTNILISDAFHGAIGEEFWTRCLGKFRVAGRQESVVIHELLGTAQQADSAAWLEPFKKGLAAFHKGDLEQAELEMHETVTARGGNDGPAQFYLGEIAALREGGLPPDWTGIVSFSGK